MESQQTTQTQGKSCSWKTTDKKTIAIIVLAVVSVLSVGANIAMLVHGRRDRSQYNRMKDGRFDGRFSDQGEGRWNKSQMPQTSQPEQSKEFSKDSNTPSGPSLNQ